MKDGRTHLAYKAEHAVDLETGALLAATLQPATAGDTSNVQETLAQCSEHIREVEVAAESKAGQLNPEGPAELVPDKGYHSNDVLVFLKEVKVRSYCSEPGRGRRNWIGKDEEKSAVDQNLRRISICPDSETASLRFNALVAPPDEAELQEFLAERRRSRLKHIRGLRGP